MNTTEELEKVLWLVGDYLIGEVSTAKEEEINRKLLEELKERLVALWAGKKDKIWIDALDKNVTAISAALELRGLTLLYEKHKKGMASALRKIRAVIKTLPQDSQLYKKAVDEIGGIEEK